MKLPILVSCIGTSLACFVSMQANAAPNFYITPYVGYSFSSSLSSEEDGVKIRTENDPHYAIAIETNLAPGRVGLFISHQPNEYKELEGDGSFTYVHFQSAIHYDTATWVDGYFGASLGTTIIDANWTSDDLVFSGSLFGGGAFHVADHVKIVLEGRWLANFIDSNTSAICQFPSGEETCRIRIDSKWLSQFQTNVGITYSF